MVAAIAAMLVAPASSGWGQEVGGNPAAEKVMQVGASEVLSFDGITRAAVSDPTVVDYVVLSAKQIMITAKGPGMASLNVWDNKGQHTFQVTVAPPPSRMPEIVKKIEAAIANPAIKVSAHDEVVILEGEVDSAYDAERAEKLARGRRGKGRYAGRGRSAFLPGRRRRQGSVA